MSLLARRRHRNSSVVWQKLWRSPAFCVGALYLAMIGLVALLSPFLKPFQAEFVDLTMRLAPPSPEHLLGCDLYGRDVLAAILHGARTTIYVSVVTVLVSTTLGTLAGLLAGFRGGLWDTAIMRVVDILMAFPGILLTLALASLLGPSLHNIIFAISATGWTGVARLVRAQVLSIRQRDYITASVAVGASARRTMLVHILPGLWSPLVISATFSLSGVILVEASLSFLGLGSQDSSPTWGYLLNQGRSVLTEAPHLSVVPGLVIMLMVLACNFMGDALRDALDPKHT